LINFVVSLTKVSKKTREHKGAQIADVRASFAKYAILIPEALTFD
jgi:hypothetical protein